MTNERADRPGATGDSWGRTEVYTFGRLLVDLYAEQLHKPLEEVTSFRKYLGGSAANTAVGLARLGAKAGLISRVGPDDFGKYLLQVLQREGVDTSMVAVDPKYPTALAFAAIFPPQDSKVLFYRKPCADTHVTVDDIDWEKALNARIVSIAGTALCESPSREAVLALLEERRRAGVLNVVDVDWRPTLWEDRHAARIYYRMALKLTDVVIANEPELEMAGESSDQETAAKNLLALGASQVVAKRGGDGVMYFGEGGPLRVGRVEVEVMNTLGAGDGFGAAYNFGLLQGWDPERRLRFANAAGAIVVSRHSCSEAMPTREEVEALLAKARV